MVGGLDDAPLKSLDKIAPLARRQRAEFIRQAVKEAIRRREYEHIREAYGAYEFLNKVIAAEITTTIRHIPIEVAIGPEEGLPKKCVVNCDNLRTIPKQNLVEKISRIPPHRIPEVKRAVGYALGWEELIEPGHKSRER
jgi:hypothetical protein